ncbi:tryptophan 2,3-dioxygenase [Streptomyces actinomycinicus]|uniref:Tryptophan 2,3-dioxygenase n=1 Tax=Streptomyces actinomycinicus TaxID=1695166 RepID=A0A937EII4_9ACTN|nr:tryptophan 2,3-dioxygenase family protein [Streptomyces actinomycinicus]MBL1082664.1 tryptophan 2,3-dioxygenase [Streptomyces actinomycinicus]
MTTEQTARDTGRAAQGSEQTAQDTRRTAQGSEQTAQDTRRAAEGTGSGSGCPLAAGPPPGTTPYAHYARMDELLALQHPLSPARTEPGFIIMSQVKELLFKLLHTELTAARDQLAGDRLGEALWTLRRSARVQQVLLVSWETFSVLSPVEFAEFRDVLGSASGFQSAGYRRLEFLLGNKNPAMTGPHRDTAGYAAVTAQLYEPSLYDAALALLVRRGLLAPDGPGNRDAAQPYRSGPQVEEAWRAVYRDPARHHDLHLLAEALMDTADQFARWRYTHLLTVQRMLGDKPGTGGTEGVAWLARISEHRFFPELWSVRSTL